jgi:hypothetical protein
MGSISVAGPRFSIKIPGAGRVRQAGKEPPAVFSIAFTSGIALRKYGNMVTTFLPRASSKG